MSAAILPFRRWPHRRIVVGLTPSGWSAFVVGPDGRRDRAFAPSGPVAESAAALIAARALRRVTGLPICLDRPYVPPRPPRPDDGERVAA